MFTCQHYEIDRNDNLIKKTEFNKKKKYVVESTTSTLSTHYIYYSSQTYIHFQN